MSSDTGFVDLRLNGQDNQLQEEGFWPSFTDIMTVVVMIFMMAMVIQRYRLSVMPGQQIVAEPMITLRPRNGIAMRLESRR